MIYEFLCDDCGHIRERTYPAALIPRIGTAVRCQCGGTARRVLSSGITFESAKLKHATRGYPFLNFAQVGLEGCAVGPNGESVIESPSHEREVGKRNNLKRR